MKYLPLVAALLLVACGKSAPPPAQTPASAPAQPNPTPVAAPLKSGPRSIDLAGMPDAVVNGDFEQAGVGDEIPGWTTMQHAGPSAFTIRVDANGAYAGNGSLHVTRTRPNVYGSLTQTLDAKAFAGKTVEFSAMLKTQGVGPKGWLLTINAGLPGTIRTSTELSGTTDWQRVSVQVKVPPSARLLTIGATLRDGGDAWMDDVSLKTLD